MLADINLIIGNILIRNPVTAYLMKKIKYLKYHNLLIKNENLEEHIFGSVLFKFYEKAEIFFLKKYFKPITTIDVGSGLGITSGILNKKYQENDFLSILVEANKKNYIFSKNLFKLNKINKNIQFLNYVFIGSSKKNFIFDIRNTLDSKIKLSKKKDDQIKSIKFDLIKKKYKFKNFQIIFDIEGEEFNFNKNLLKELKYCERAIIEIHTRSKIKQNKFIKRLRKYSNLRLKEKKNFTFYFEK
jgi:FkbM family methyltransferase